MDKEKEWYLDWDIINQCNLKCRFCAKSNIVNSCAKSEFDFTKMDLLIRKLIELKIGRVLLGGGEPLLHKKLSLILLALSRNGIKNGITTNGTLMTKSMAREIIESGVGEVYFSIDNMDYRINDRVRGRDSFDKALSGLNVFLDECANENYNSVPYVGLSVTLYKGSMENKDEVYRIMEFAHDSGIDGLLFVFAQPVCSGRNYAREMDGRTQVVISENIAEVSRKFNDLNIVLYQSPRMEKYLKEKYPDSNIVIANSFCMAGESMAYLTSDLKIYPCHTVFCDDEFVGEGLKSYFSEEAFSNSIFEIEDISKMDIMVEYGKIKEEYRKNPPIICKCCFGFDRCHGVCRMHNIVRSKDENQNTWIQSCCYLDEIE